MSHQLTKTDREAIDKAIREHIGFITGLNDDDRIDYLEDDEQVFESAVRYGLKLEKIS